MTDLRAAVERLRRMYLNGELAHVVYGEDYQQDYSEDLCDVIVAYLAAPQWLPRPSGPGLWVCVPENKSRFNQITTIDLTADDLARGAPFYVSRVYGPIPKDELNHVTGER